MQDAGANGFKGAVEGTTLAVSVGLNNLEVHTSLYFDEVAQRPLRKQAAAYMNRLSATCIETWIFSRYKYRPTVRRLYPQPPS
jgi:hypothetical protein